MADNRQYRAQRGEKMKSEAHPPEGRTKGRQLRLVLLVAAILATAGCKPPPVAKYEKHDLSGGLYNHSAEVLHVEEFDLNFTNHKMGGGRVLPGTGGSITSLMRSSEVPEVVKIYWNYGDRKYSQRIVLRPPLDDLRHFEGFDFHFEESRCWVTYRYIFGQGDGGYVMEFNEDGSMTAKIRLVIAVQAYRDPELGKEVKAAIAAREGRISGAEQPAPPVAAEPDNPQFDIFNNKK